MKKFVLVMTILGLIAFVLLPVLLATGCAYNRNAPLLDLNVEANGNTVPLVGQ